MYEQGNPEFAQICLCFFHHCTFCTTLHTRLNEFIIVHLDIYMNSQMNILYFVHILTLEHCLRSLLAGFAKNIILTYTLILFPSEILVKLMF